MSSIRSHEQHQKPWAAAETMSSSSHEPVSHRLFHLPTRTTSSGSFVLISKAIRDVKQTMWASKKAGQLRSAATSRTEVEGSSDLHSLEQSVHTSCQNGHAYGIIWAAILEFNCWNHFQNRSYTKSSRWWVFGLFTANCETSQIRHLFLNHAKYRFVYIRLGGEGFLKISWSCILTVSVWLIEGVSGCCVVNSMHGWYGDIFFYHDTHSHNWNKTCLW